MASYDRCKGICPGLGASRGVINENVGGGEIMRVCAHM